MMSKSLYLSTSTPCSTRPNCAGPPWLRLALPTGNEPSLNGKPRTSLALASAAVMEPFDSSAIDALMPA